MSSISVSYYNGIPIVNYNSIIGENPAQIEVDGKIYDGFYVSYNSYDIAIYGDITTALVLGQMQKFYILNGDHREEYKKIIGDGFEKCMEYFLKNISQINKNSEKPQTKED